MRKADNRPPYRTVVMKSGSLNFLEPSGPARPVMGELYLYTLFDHKRNEEVFEELKVEPVDEKQIKLATTCNKNEQQNAKIMLNYRPNGRGRPARPLKRLLDEAETGVPRPNT